MGPGHDGGAGAAVLIYLLLAAVAGKEQMEDVGHGAVLGPGKRMTSTLTP